MKDQSRYALAYFFFSYTEEDKQNVYNMLSSIAGQLCRHARTIPEKVITELDRNMTRLPTSVLLELVSCLCQCFSQVYIVLDALDEVKLDEISSLIDTLHKIIWLQSNVHLFITSRHENYLINGFKGLPIRDIPLTSAIVDNDIKLYVT
ncbi:MAG TPA: hypothetical protein VGO47_11340, partial [Chlamydiales bacterium]|nr:hypothetical protein [Chlamydiales bacterium]